MFDRDRQEAENKLNELKYQRDQHRNQKQQIRAEAESAAKKLADGNRRLQGKHGVNLLLTSLNLNLLSRKKLLLQILSSFNDIDKITDPADQRCQEST